METVSASGGIRYSTEKMLEFKNKSINLLHEFTNNQARQALEQLIEYTIERKK